MHDVDRLFREYHQPLVRYLTRRLGDRDWAEEVAQETFLRAVKQESIVSERSWLFAVATNLVRDEARKDIRRRRRLELLREQARAEEAVDPEPLGIERAEEAAAARKALDQLTERDREALLMREEGLDYNEIASALDLSVASVGTTLSRARRRLVEAYESLQRSGAPHEDHMQHLEEGEIHAWLDGALSEAEGARIEQHASTCTECAAMVADARGLIAGAARIVSALDHVPSGVIPKSGTAATASRPLWRVLRLTPFRAAMAASLMVVAGSLFVFQGGNKISVPMPMTAAAPAIAPAPAPPAADTSQKIDALAANQTRPLAKAKGNGPQQSVSKTTLALKDTGLFMKQADSSAPAVLAPKVASAQDERAKRERDAALSSVVAPAAPASALGAAARSASRGAAANQTAAREPVRDSARADIALRRPLPLAMQRAEAASSFANFLGCYQVVDSTTWPAPLPVRFEMVRDSDRVHLIRPGVEQRPAIGRWQNTGSQSAAITLDGSNTASFTLTQIGTEVLATPASAPSVRLRVLRSSCAR